MPTVIAFECADGAVVAADRLALRGDAVASRNEDRVLDFDACGGAAVDDPDTVRRELDAKVREYETDHGGHPTIEPFTRLASDVLSRVGTDAAVAARDEDGTARVRAVYTDGAVLEDDPLALGTGAELALGRLEGAGLDRELADALELAEEVVAGVSERDPRTGEDVDSFGLASE